MVDIEKLKQLREETSVSISECRKALQEANGDIEKAKEVLRSFGEKIADKKSSRDTNTGIIESYIHPNKKIGVLLDIRSESDFVSKSEGFKELAHDICLQIAALNPLFVSMENIPEEILDKEKIIAEAQFKDSKKPENILKEIIEGKLEKFKKENSLLEQLWIKNSEKTIKDLISQQIAKFGENIIIKSFIRYEI